MSSLRILCQNVNKNYLHVDTLLENRKNDMPGDPLWCLASCSLVRIKSVSIPDRGSALRLRGGDFSRLGTQSFEPH